MKILCLFLILAATIGFCVWQMDDQSAVTVREKRNVGIKWNDSLMKHLPKGIDTNILVTDLHHTPLRFYQYVKIVFNHDAIIYQDRGNWRLHRLTETSQDSLKKDDYAVAARARWDAYRTPDTIQSWGKKLDNIKNTLAQADHILVLKRKRKMMVTRKGVEVLNFSINLGFSPIGDKQYDGDGKTPEGIYHLDNKFEREDEFHKSYSISYPDANDKLIAKQKGLKPGFGVSIHGTKPKKTNAKDWTAGCIALQNKDIDTLFKYVGDGTVIEIRK
jgi:L,D-peptidoglycan transpeptidase YkuD (ErfK/YbiS/YcfS/YnhG family)